METIKELLDYYITLQPIEVVYRPNERVPWGRNRKMYDGNCNYEYNHRTILDNEVVFDFDSEKMEENLDNSWLVCEKLVADNIDFSVWDTGNKGIHIHTFWSNLSEFKDRALMKKTILKHYAYGMNIDYQLAGKHLVRMEYGKNEKRRSNEKQPLYFEGTIQFNIINDNLIEQYKLELNRYIERRLTTPANVDEQIIKDFLEGKYIIKDGREKFLFFLINELKTRIPQDELGTRLITWYRYSGGSKLSDQEIRIKVHYHYASGVNYTLGLGFFKSLLKMYQAEIKEE